MIKFIPGVHPSYKEQFDKLTRAYISNKVNPWDECACFVGNLLNNEGIWSTMRFGNADEIISGASEPIRVFPNGFLTCTDVMKAENCIDKESAGLYTPEEICQLENMFIGVIVKSGGNYMAWQHNEIETADEQSLFTAFSKTLDLLKQIHLSKGEIIDEVPEFKRRVMV